MKNLSDKENVICYYAPLSSLLFIPHHVNPFSELYVVILERRQLFNNDKLLSHVHESVPVVELLLK